MRKTPERLLPVQQNGDVPLNYWAVEAPTSEPTQAQQVVERPMNEERVIELTSILQKYKEGKTNLEKRIIENEQWWKGRNWEQIRRPGEKKSEIEPSSAYLFNAIANKHADFMDNFPHANILPREADDQPEAKILSSIIPVVLDQCGFEQTYSDVSEYKLKAGTGVTSVLWDKNAHNGLGDIKITKVDLLNVFWEPGITNIQDSPYLFVTAIKDNKYLEGAYPELRGKLGGQGGNVTVSEYIYDDTVDTTDKTVVVDCYYKVRNGTKTILHLVTFVGSTILYASENEPDRNKGVYDHGRYPFEFDPLFKVEGTPAGFGYIDVGKSAQEYIDRMDKALIESLEIAARPRTLITDACGINPDEYANLANLVVKATDLSDDNIRILQQPSVNGIYVSIKENKVQELKEVTGNRDVSNGGTTSGVTAASAIAAMQEAGSKLSRNMISASYRSFRNIVLLVIELIRQFYDTPRQFRIMGSKLSPDEYQFISYTNEKLIPQPQGEIGGEDMGLRLPLFDVEITAEKASPYSRMSRNELALQFYGAGFFAPNNADAALACLEMMDFDNKEQVVQRISNNGTLYEALMQRTQQALSLAQMTDAATGSQYLPQMVNEIQSAAGQTPPPQGAAQMPTTTGGESGVTRNARRRVAESTTPT